MIRDCYEGMLLFTPLVVTRCLEWLVTWTNSGDCREQQKSVPPFLYVWNRKNSDEIQCLACRLDGNKSTTDSLPLICDDHMCKISQNLTIALKILLTFLVSTVLEERSFSWLKLIKHYLRSSMCNERLTPLGPFSRLKVMNRVI